MLNIICAASLAIAAGVCQAEPIQSLENLATLRTVEIVSEPQLAKGRRYESDYRNEADRAREEHQRNREHYRYDRHEVEYNREDRGRIYRDAEQRRREENLESERPRDRHRNRSRERRDRSIYYWRQD